MGAKVTLESRVAGKSSVTLTADVAANTSMDLHVALQRLLRLKAFPTQQTKHSHV